MNKLSSMLNAYAEDAGRKIDFEIEQVRLASASATESLGSIANAIGTVRDMLHKQIDDATALLMQAVANASHKASTDFASVATSLEATKAEIIAGEVERLPGNPATRAQLIDRINATAAEIIHATADEATTQEQAA